jgi:hypothetical protein
MLDNVRKKLQETFRIGPEHSQAVSSDSPLLYYVKKILLEPVQGHRFDPGSKDSFLPATLLTFIPMPSNKSINPIDFELIDRWISISKETQILIMLP